MRIVLLLVFCVYVFAQNLKIRVGSKDVDFKLLGSGMVLQRDSTTTRIWGEGTNGQVSIQISHNGQVIDTYKATAQNKWETYLKPYVAGGPYEITVTTPTSTQKYQNVLFGDVYVCSGQSNSKIFDW
jgi:sialate O-acetylesterase